MRSIIINLLLCLTFAACAHSQEVGSFTSKKTDRHVNVIGTRVFLIPPEGFKQESGYVGFHRVDGNKGFIQVRDLSTPFDSMRFYYARERQSSDGYTLKEYEDISVNQYRGKYFVVERETWKAMTIVFGDSTFFVSLMSGFPPNKQFEDQIRSTFSSVYYDTAFVVDPLAIAPFVVDHSATKFKLANYSSGVYVYTSDGNRYPKDRVGINVLPTTKDGMTAEEFLLYHAGSIGGVSDVMLKNKGAITVNGHPGYEAEQYFTYNGKDFVKYLAAIADNEKIILIEGYIESDYEKNLSDVRKFVNAISLR